jgi:hypothetical protein
VVVTISNRLVRMALAGYPPSFRERYGTELAGLVQDTAVTPRTVVDLMIGAARAWGRAALPADPAERGRRRLQASVTTAWATWCAAVLVAPVIDRALLDPPPPDVPAAVRPLLAVGMISTGLVCVLVAIAGAPLLARTLLPAIRSRERPILRPLLPAAVLVPVEAVGLVGIVAWRRTYPRLLDHPHLPPLFVTTVVLWSVGFLAMIVAAAGGPAIAVTRAAPSLRTLRAAAVLAPPLALLLSVATVTSAVALALMAGNGGRFGLAFVSAGRSTQATFARRP